MQATIYFKKNQHLKMTVYLSLNPTVLRFKPILHGGKLLPLSRFLRDKSLEKKVFLNQLDFESNFVISNSYKKQVAKVTGSFPILRFSKI